MFKKIFTLILISGLTHYGHAQEQLTLYFDFDKYDLTTSSKASMDKIMARQNYITAISLQGHCDAVGADVYNIALSLKRVNAVRQYLMKRKTTGWDLTVKGLGESFPVADNETADNRQLNRRVEILITRKNNPDEDKTLTDKLKDSTIIEGSQVILPMINFVGGHHQFLPESLPMLDQLLNAMNNFPNLVIEIQGHICCQPDNREGLDNETGLFNLSFARAREVYQFLVTNGIEKTRLSYKGFGHSVPLYPYPEKTEEEMTANRRVEIKILKK